MEKSITEVWSLVKPGFIEYVVNQSWDKHACVGLVLLSG